MIPLAPLWADGLGELLPILIVIIFFILSAAGQWLAKKGQPQQPGRAGPRPRPGQPPAPPLGGGVEDEIEEFLRRAARRAGQPPPRPQPAEPPAMAEIVEPQLVRPRPVGGQIGRHVGEFLSTGQFERRADELGDEVAQADDKIDQRLRQVFDHGVSQLAGVPGESAGVPKVEEAQQPEDRVTELPPAAAAGLAALLGNAENLRQAIILSEILQRPEQRWT